MCTERHTLFFGAVHFIRLDPTIAVPAEALTNQKNLANTRYATTFDILFPARGPAVLDSDSPFDPQLGDRAKRHKRKKKKKNGRIAVRDIPAGVEASNCSKLKAARTTAAKISPPPPWRFGGFLMVVGIPRHADGRLTSSSKIAKEGT